MEKAYFLLGFGSKETVNITGSGGKTTLMFQLAKELSGEGKRVVTSTTTKIFIPDRTGLHDCMFLKFGMEDFLHYVNEKKDSGFHITVGWEPDKTGNKILGVSKSILEEIAGRNIIDYLINEADGSKGKPLKGYIGKEPVKIGRSSKTLVIVGLGVIGKPLCDRNVHRSHIVSELLKKDHGHQIEANDVADLLLHEKGYLTGSDNEIMILNGIENKKQLESALLIKKRILSVHKGKKIVFRGPVFGIDEISGCFGMISE